MSSDIRIPDYKRHFGGTGRSYSWQRDQRINFRRAPRRNETGNKSDTDQQQGDASEGRRISHAHVVEQILQDARQGQAATKPSATPISVSASP